MKAKPREWTLVYLCVRRIEYASLLVYEFSIGFWNCSESVVLFVCHFTVYRYDNQIIKLYVRSFNT